MTPFAFLWSVLRLAGRRWTVWPVAIVLTIAHRAEGASGLDAAAQALGPAILWAVFSYACRFLTSGANPWQRSILPTNAPLPTPQPALIVVTPCPPEASPDVAQMVERLPEHLRCLVTCQAD